MKLRDRVWIWGHPENSLKGNFGIDKDSSVSPVNGMEYLGAKNIFYVPKNARWEYLVEHSKDNNIGENFGKKKN